MPVTVTSWAKRQLTVVNVRTVGATEASDGSDAVTLITTVPVGCESSTTWKDSVVPDSDTVATRAETVNPEVSSSSVEIVTDWSAKAA